MLQIDVQRKRGQRALDLPIHDGSSMHASYAPPVAAKAAMLANGVEARYDHHEESDSS